MDTLTDLSEKKLELSKKQQISYAESNEKINIWQGAVRSGKTYISLWRFLTELAEGPDGEYVLITRTYDSFKRNVLPLLESMIGIKDVGWRGGLRYMNIYGKKVHVVGADDERAESKIRGPTFSGAYVDEITIIPESVFKMLISRCAMGEAKIFGTTNPDSPYHWLKKDVLENNSDVKSWQFTLEDNPQLLQKDKDYLKRQYKGLWYERFIEGKWVQAEGAIYEFFTKERCVISTAPSYTSAYIVGVDYGTTNPCAFALIGIDRNRFPHFWLEDEYYFDSKVHQRQKTDTEYGEDLQKFLEGRPVHAIYLDPSAVSFRMELQKQGIQNLYEGDNDVISGIHFVRKLLANGTFKILEGCHHAISEFQSYVWDEKAAQRGIDKPKKQNDHCLTGDSVIWTTNGKIPIKDLKYGNRKVLSFNHNTQKFGFYGYIDPRKTRKKQKTYKVTLENGKTVRATADHKLFTKRGYIEIQDLLPTDEVMCYSS
ncbi:MAG: PBSX family phage terminase large subunit [Bacteroidales bacterium]